MKEPLRVAIAGVGRMGAIHAFHLNELARENGSCAFSALAEPDSSRAESFCREANLDIPIFSSIEELAQADACDAGVIVTPTDKHRGHAAVMIDAGKRVLLEKPLTGALEADREFAAHLDRVSPKSLMLAFQRRFDAPLLYAKELMKAGAIGRVFKIYSALEDSNPAPDGYASGGILPDMSVHNVDEILWLTERMPNKALAVGTRVYSHKLTTSEEDFDDATLYFWFDADLMAQVQVSRNHVSGYRVETVLFGDKGQIQIGHFEQNPAEVVVAAYGKRNAAEPIARRAFPMRSYGRQLPEFVDRFGAAYKTELATFIDCCRSDSEFPTSHRDGVRAQEVISAGMQAMTGNEQAATIRPVAIR